LPARLRRDSDPLLGLARLSMRILLRSGLRTLAKGASWSCASVTSLSRGRFRVRLARSSLPPAPRLRARTLRDGLALVSAITQLMCRRSASRCVSLACAIRASGLGRERRGPRAVPASKARPQQRSRVAEAHLAALMQSGPSSAALSARKLIWATRDARAEERRKAGRSATSEPSRAQPTRSRRGYTECRKRGGTEQAAVARESERSQKQKRRRARERREGRRRRARERGRERVLDSDQGMARETQIRQSAQGTANVAAGEPSERGRERARAESRPPARPAPGSARGRPRRETCHSSMQSPPHRVESFRVERLGGCERG